AALQLNPLALPAYDLRHPWPLDILDMRVATDQGASFQPPVAFLAPRSCLIPDFVVAGKCGQAEQQVQELVQGSLVLFDHHEIVTAQREDQARGRLEGMQRIQSDDLATQIALSQQKRYGAALIALVCHLLLGQDGCTAVLDQADQLTRVAVSS